MRVEVLGGVERRGRWSRDDKMRVNTSMLDTLTARTFHVFECRCGNRTWTSEKA
jgi:hypothetical protein